MTNVVLAAYLATNALLCGTGVNDICWTNDPSWTKALQVTQRCIMPREIYCPVCQNVTTQEVDVTDLDNHYRQLQSIDLRCHMDSIRMFRSESNSMAEKYDQLKEGYRKLKDELVHAGAKVAERWYRIGTTNGLRTASDVLRSTCNYQPLNAEERSALIGAALSIDRFAESIKVQELPDGQDTP